MDKAKIILKYNEKEYIIFYEYGCKLPDGGTFTFEDLKFLWEEGNDACDCNRSIFIKRKCDTSFPKMGCGDIIDLVSIEKTSRERGEKRDVSGKMD